MGLLSMFDNSLLDDNDNDNDDIDDFSSMISDWSDPDSASAEVPSFQDCELCFDSGLWKKLQCCDIAVCGPCMATYITEKVNFYTSTKSWRGYIFTSVCLCVCECALRVNKIPAEWENRFGRGFAKWLITALAQTRLKLVTLGQRSRSQ